MSRFYRTMYENPSQESTINKFRIKVIRMGVAAHETVGICFKSVELANLTYLCLTKASKFSLQPLKALKAISAIMLKTPEQYQISVLQYIHHIVSTTKTSKFEAIIIKYEKLLNADKTTWLKIMAWFYGISPKDLKHEKWNNIHWSEKAVKIIQYQVDRKKIDIKQLWPQLLILNQWQLIRWSYRLNDSFVDITSAKVTENINNGLVRLTAMFGRIEKMRVSVESKGVDSESPTSHFSSS